MSERVFSTGRPRRTSVLRRDVSEVAGEQAAVAQAQAMGELVWRAGTRRGRSNGCVSYAARREGIAL